MGNPLIAWLDNTPETRTNSNWRGALAHDPYDYWQSLQKAEWDMPEKSLIAQVLLIAIQDLRGISQVYAAPGSQDKRRIDESRQTVAWFNSPRDTPFSFLHIVETLFPEISADYLRRKILALDRKGLRAGFHGSRRTRSPDRVRAALMRAR